jgi:hypothetical protein
MKTARPDFGRADQRDEKRLLGYRNSSQRKIPFVNFIERNFALVDGSLNPNLDLI